MLWPCREQSEGLCAAVETKAVGNSYLLAFLGVLYRAEARNTHIRKVHLHQSPRPSPQDAWQPVCRYWLDINLTPRGFSAVRSLQGRVKPVAMTSS